MSSGKHDYPGRAGGTRTPTRVAPQRILSPVCLPFHHCPSKPAEILGLSLLLSLGSADVRWVSLRHPLWLRHYPSYQTQAHPTTQKRIGQEDIIRGHHHGPLPNDKTEAQPSPSNPVAYDARRAAGVCQPRPSEMFPSRIPLGGGAPALGTLSWANRAKQDEADFAHKERPDPSGAPRECFSPASLSQAMRAGTLRGGVVL